MTLLPISFDEMEVIWDRMIKNGVLPYALKNCNTGQSFMPEYVSWKWV